MSKYFIHRDGNKTGPFNLEELKNLNLDSNSYVWFEGLANWTIIKNVPELQNIFSASPPPFMAVMPPPFAASQPTKRNYAKIASFIGVGILSLYGLKVGVKMLDKPATTVENPVQTVTPPPPVENPVNPKKTNILVPSISDKPVNITVKALNGKDEGGSGSVGNMHERGDDWNKPPSEYDTNVGNIRQKEKENPMRFVVAKFDHSENFWNNDFVSGSIRNIAKVITLKDPVIRYNFYSKTETLISSKVFTIYETIGPGKKYPFSRRKIYPPANCSKVEVELVSIGVKE